MKHPFIARRAYRCGYIVIVNRNTNQGITMEGTWTAKVWRIIDKIHTRFSKKHKDNMINFLNQANGKNNS